MFYKSDILKQKVYKTGQVSKLIGVSIQTVIRYCETGVLPHGRTAKNYRIIEANDLANYLEKQGLLTCKRSVKMLSMRVFQLSIK